MLLYYIQFFIYFIFFVILQYIPSFLDIHFDIILLYEGFK